MAEAYAQTQVILRASHEVKMATRNALRGERGFLLTGDAAYLEAYLTAREDLARSLDRLSSAAGDAAGSADAASDLRLAASTYLGQLATVLALARGGKKDRAIEMVRLHGPDDGLAKIDKHVDGMIEAQRLHMGLIAGHSDGVTTMLLRFIYMMSGAGLCLLVLSIVSAVALRRSFARERTYRAELQKRADTDELTGVANRRQLLTVLNMRIAEARASGTPLSFAMFDLDNFKNVNDTHGHAVGDRTIRHVVRTAQRMVRATI